VIRFEVGYKNIRKLIGRALCEIIKAASKLILTKS